MPDVVSITCGHAFGTTREPVQVSIRQDGKARTHTLDFQSAADRERLHKLVADANAAVERGEFVVRPFTQHYAAFGFRFVRVGFKEEIS